MVIHYGYFRNRLTIDEDDTDSEDGEEGKGKEDERPQSQFTEPLEEEDWEAEINNNNNKTPYAYEPEDVISKGLQQHMTLSHVPSHSPAQVRYNPSIYHVPPVRWFHWTTPVAIKDQFEDAEE